MGAYWLLCAALHYSTYCMNIARTYITNLDAGTNCVDHCGKGTIHSSNIKADSETLTCPKPYSILYTIYYHRLLFPQPVLFSPHP